MLQEDYAHFLQWFCLVWHTANPSSPSPSSKDMALEFLAFCLGFHLLLPAASIIPVPALGLQPSGFVIFSLDQLAFLAGYKAACLAGKTACFATSKSQVSAALFGLGRNAKAGRIPVSGRWTRWAAFRGLRESRQAWLAAVCDLWSASRALGGYGISSWGPRGSGVCLGSWGGRCAGDFFVQWLPWQREGAFRQRGRAPDTPTRLRAGQPALRQGMDFSGHLPYAQGPRQEKFP